MIVGTSPYGRHDQLLVCVRSGRVSVHQGSRYNHRVEIWDLWYPNAGAQGLAFCRARLDHVEEVLVHAAPESLRVEVRADGGALLAKGDQLHREGSYFPMTRLRREGERVLRTDGWPTPADMGHVVLLSGGEAGILKGWWNAPEGNEWRWSVEFYNRS